MAYAYVCEACDFVGNLYDVENEAWGDGVQHNTNTGHENGHVKEFSG